jgi:hypothetical protein
MSNDDKPATSEAAGAQTAAQNSASEVDQEAQPRREASAEPSANENEHAAGQKAAEASEVVAEQGGQQESEHRPDAAAASSGTPGPRKRDVTMLETAERVRQLIRYSSETGIELEKSTSEFVLDFTGDVLDGHSPTPEREARFWAVVSQLSRKLQPVTYETLSDSRKRSKRWVITFGLIATIALGLLVTAQMYWVMLNNVSDALNRSMVEAQKHRIAAATAVRDLVGLQQAPLEVRVAEDLQESDLTASSEAAQVAQSPMTPSKARLEAESDALSRMQNACLALRQELFTISNTRTAVENLLVKEDRIIGEELVDMGRIPGNKALVPIVDACDDLQYNGSVALGQGQSREDLSIAGVSEADLIRAAALNRWARQVLQAMAEYVLPLLYGTVGALAFVLRSLSGKIRALTFDRSLVVQYFLRIVLGALAGISVGWFLRPHEAATGDLITLSPLALAFIAGYSVELVFTAMDKFLAAFIPNETLRADLDKPRTQRDDAA